MTEAAGRTNLLGMTRPELEAFVGGFGAKPFRARQLLKWMYRRGESDFSRMTDLARDFRAALAERAVVAVPEIVSARTASDGTRKWLLRMPGAAGNEQVIETVFIPEPGRGTLCISSQIGCALDCSFCATGAQGFNRNLTAAEIIGQVWLANRELGREPDGERIVTNVVLMGMGEPLANYRNVLPAMQLMLDDFGYDLSRRRVTLSTSGLVPQIYRLAEDCNVALAVSLHAPNDRLRDSLVPINRIHPDRRAARSLLALPRAPERPQRHLRVHDAGSASTTGPSTRGNSRGCCAAIDAKVNLIPFNTFPGTRYRRSPAEAIRDFRDLLVQGGVMATVRKTRGDDIDAACGQLRGQVLDRTQVRLGRKLGGLAVRA